MAIVERARGQWADERPLAVEAAHGQEGRGGE